MVWCFVIKSFIFGIFRKTSTPLYNNSRHVHCTEHLCKVMWMRLTKYTNSGTFLRIPCVKYVCMSVYINAICWWFAFSAANNFWLYFILILFNATKKFNSTKKNAFEAWSNQRPGHGISRKMNKSNHHCTSAKAMNRTAYFFHWHEKIIWVCWRLTASTGCGWCCTFAIAGKSFIAVIWTATCIFVTQLHFKSQHRIVLR